MESLFSLRQTGCPKALEIYSTKSKILGSQITLTFPNDPDLALLPFSVFFLNLTLFSLK